MEDLVVEEALVHEERLHGVAGGGVVCLGVAHNLHRLGGRALRVQVHVTNPVGVAQHGDALGALLDGADQLVGAARNDEVDVLKRKFMSCI